MSQGIRPVLWIAPILQLGLIASLTACRLQPAVQPPEQGSNDALQVIATTTILGNIVQQIGGDNVQVSVLVPPGADPHTFQPAPSEVRAIATADLVVTSGAGLDAFLDRLLESAIDPGEQGKIISASDGIDLRRLALSLSAENQAQAEISAGESEIDPHVWFDPNNVIIWTGNIEQALSQADPDNAAHYSANAEAYCAELETLDAWIEDQVAQIPVENRRLVSDHQTLGYLAGRYGFEVVGTLIPGSSAAAEPSAEDLADLVDSIPALGVKAIFVGSTVSPALAQQVAADTGVQLVSIYTDSLTPPGGEASSYLDLMRYDLKAIMEALK